MYNPSILIGSQPILSISFFQKHLAFFQKEANFLEKKIHEIKTEYLPQQTPCLPETTLTVEIGNFEHVQLRANPETCAIWIVLENGNETEGTRLPRECFNETCNCNE